jgi:hypothetical protein
MRSQSCREFAIPPEAPSEVSALSFIKGLGSAKEMALPLGDHEPLSGQL